MIVDFESNEDTSDGGKFVGKCSGAVCECARDAKELVKFKKTNFQYLHYVCLQQQVGCSLTGSP